MFMIETHAGVFAALQCFSARRFTSERRGVFCRHAARKLGERLHAWQKTAMV
jgi:hypothetical protein